MSIRSIALAAVFTFVSSAHAAAPASLNDVIKASMAGSKVPAVGALVMRDGKITEQAVRGLRRNDGKAQVKLDDVWLIGSTGKVMTVAMLARLVERGVLRWDATLDVMLPDLAAGMRADYRKVTLVQLLSHQSGLPRDIRDVTLLDAYFGDKRPFSEQRLELVAAALKDMPEPTGNNFSYSNTGFLIAAVIAEKATGKTYEELMRSEVFGPLEMRHAGFGNTENGQNRGHQQGKPQLTMRKADDGAPDMYAPAGFLHMSLADWARFNLDQLAGSKGQGKLLKPASYSLMQTAQPGSPAGLDWGVQASVAGRKGPALVHQGSDGNWLAIVVLFPEQGTGALVVANAAEDMGAEKVLNGVLMNIFPSLSPAK